jgi:hypothetical protein
MIHSFRECTSLTSIDFSNFREPKLIKLQNAIYESTYFKSVNLSSVESDDFRTLGDTFYGCHSLEYIYLPKTTAKKELSLSNIFTYCYSLKSIDLSKYNELYSNGKTFEGRTNLNYIDISSSDIAPKNLFKDLPKTGEIKLNKKAYNDIKDEIP